MLLGTLRLGRLSVDKALNYLKQKVTESTGGQLKPNFIVKGIPKGKITLDLGDLPASEVLRYIAELSGYQLSYDPHAAVLSSKTAPTIQEQHLTSESKRRGKK